jgi:hypothetical protein
MSPVRYELGFYITEDAILHSHRRESLKHHMNSFMFTFKNPNKKLQISRDHNKNGVFWDVTPCGSCKNRIFGGIYRLLHQGDKNR